MANSDIDALLDSIESMIDAQDDMHEEEKYSNYRQVMEIREERYRPAKQAARVALEQIIRQMIREELQRMHITDLETI